MKSARPGAPAHVIRVNVDHRQHADYIVAAQCAMLLVMWSDPAKVPGIAFERSKCDYLAHKWARTKQLAVLPADNAAAMANYYLEGLLKQLLSEPLEIRVVNLYFDSCPSLRDSQAELLTAHQRAFPVQPGMQNPQEEKLWCIKSTNESVLARSRSQRRPCRRRRGGLRGPHRS
jgi:hypothetical protein